jgi:oligoribonuclease (3'-5' exoribonuclease)
MTDNIFPDVMVDVETTGVQFDRCGIIQIAAVRFNLREGTFDPHSFDMALTLPSTRMWEENCRDWWHSSQGMIDTLHGIQRRAQSPQPVMEAFARWVRANNNPQDGVTFWAKPTSFDFSFVESYFRELDVLSPFHYRNQMDLNTFIRSRFFPEDPPKLEQTIPFSGSEHNAIDDVWHQIKVVFEGYRLTQQA